VGRVGIVGTGVAVGRVGTVGTGTVVGGVGTAGTGAAVGSGRPGVVPRSTPRCPGPYGVEGAWNGRTTGCGGAKGQSNRVGWGRGVLGDGWRAVGADIVPAAQVSAMRARVVSWRSAGRRVMGSVMGPTMHGEGDRSGRGRPGCG
jgi:hypothetical protein